MTENIAGSLTLERSTHNVGEGLTGSGHPPPTRSPDLEPSAGDSVYIQFSNSRLPHGRITGIPAVFWDASKLSSGLNTALSESGRSQELTPPLELEETCRSSISLPYCNTTIHKKEEKGEKEGASAPPWQMLLSPFLAFSVFLTSSVLARMQKRMGETDRSYRFVLWISVMHTPFRARYTLSAEPTRAR
ncbi:hypothetical protein K435DRAFT_847621 [Dendrothele bispora CBS 962.96]|uniref:Uncharacterized protein n=1 Tax=Dendrothele bispora (strain CBS 962.96) TaxID=1314807 RepID=A0A4S8MWT1_DENBC|nr:hypothetical protein K435DRAFT_847621 [Dendrothele bispora CBS 962.96]